MSASETSSTQDLAAGHIMVAVDQVVLDVDGCCAAKSGAGVEVAPGGFIGRIVEADECVGAVGRGDRVAAFGPVRPQVSCGREQVIRVPADLPDEEAALLPLCELALSIAERLAPTESLAVVHGLGGLGIMVGMALRQAGCPAVVGVDKREARRRLAAGAGLRPVEALPRPGGEEQEEIALAVETTGDPEAILRLLDLMARMGRLALAGPSRGRTAEVDFYSTVHRRGLVVIGIPDPGRAGGQEARANSRSYSLDRAVALASQASRLAGMARDALGPAGDPSGWPGDEPLVRIRFR